MDKGVRMGAGLMWENFGVWVNPKKKSSIRAVELERDEHGSI